MDDLKKIGEELRTIVWSTECARFNAARRLHLRATLSIFSIAILSAIALAIPIIQKIYGLEGSGLVDKHYAFGSIFLSISILVLSLLEAGNDYARRAERLHINAIELSKLVRKFRFVLLTTDEPQLLKKTLDDLRHEYDTLIDNCVENHKLIDYELFLTQHRHSPEFASRKIGCLKSVAINVKWWVNTLWLYTLLLFMPILFFVCFPFWTTIGFSLPPR